MPGTSPDRHTARARLARCVAAVAVLVGLVLLPCADGMMMTGEHTAHGATSAMAADGPAAMAQADAEAPGPRDMGGLLATCLAFLVAVVATVLGLRPPWRRTVVRILARAPRRRVAGPRTPSLAKLCLLRT